MHGRAERAVQWGDSPAMWAARLAPSQYGHLGDSREVAGLPDQGMAGVGGGVGEGVAESAGNGVGEGLGGVVPAAGLAAAPSAWPADPWARSRREASTITAEDILYVPHAMAVFDAKVRAKLDDIIARLRKNAYDQVEIAAGAFARTETLTSHKTKAIRTYLILRDIDEARITTRIAYPGDEHLDALWYARRSAVQITVKWSPPKVFMIPLTLGKNESTRRFARHPVLPYA